MKNGWDDLKKKKKTRKTTRPKGKQTPLSAARVKKTEDVSHGSVMVMWLKAGGGAFAVVSGRPKVPSQTQTQSQSRYGSLSRLQAVRWREPIKWLREFFELRLNQLLNRRAILRDPRLAARRLRLASVVRKHASAHDIGAAPVRLSIKTPSLNARKTTTKHSECKYTRAAVLRILSIIQWQFGNVAVGLSKPMKKVYVLGIRRTTSHSTFHMDSNGHNSTLLKCTIRRATSVI